MSMMESHEFSRQNNVNWRQDRCRKNTNSLNETFEFYRVIEISKASCNVTGKLSEESQIKAKQTKERTK